MAPPDSNGDPPFRAKSMFDLWCAYDAATKGDPAAKLLGAMIFKLFDGQQEIRARSNRNWMYICGLIFTISLCLSIETARLFGVTV